jgi:replicative DNA helicase
MREIVITCSEVTAEARDDHADVDEWMNGAERRIYKAFERQQLGTVKELPALGTMLFEDLVSRRDPETGKRLQQPIVPSGYAPLDHYLDGGMSPGEFVIIAARPSMGKTAFVLNIALNNGVPRWNQPVEEVQPVLFFSMEMSHTQIARRIAGIEAGIPVSRLKRGDLDARLMLQLVREMNRVQRGHVAVDEEGGLSINELRARARRWRADPRRFQKGGKQIGLIVVDYMQLATAGGERLHRTPIANREQEVSAISRGLKAMAKELHLPVIGLSQLNRAVDSRENHRPILSDLRESGAIEQDADVIMFVYRGARYLPPKPTPEQRAEVENKAEIIIGKARDGQTNTAHLYFFEDTQKFADVEHQTVPAAPLIPQENWAP